MKKFGYLLLTGGLVMFASMTATGLAEPSHLSGNDEVAVRGARVMPFDLDKTLHLFTKTEQGGIQRVIAKDLTDAPQITLIQAHLAAVAVAFAKGDFSAPETIHGLEMPGLAALKAAQPGNLEVHYQPLSDGGQIIYSTSLPALVAAIHQWFDAQLRDHARHAMPGHAPQHHPPTPAEP